MYSVKRLAVFVTLACLLTVSFCAAGAVDNEPDAAELVRAVRESENWIHNIDSLYIRIESTWTRTSEAIAAQRALLRELSSNPNPELNQIPEMKPVSKGTLEYAVDEGRVRFLSEESDYARLLSVWDGKKFISHENYFFSKQEQYQLNWTPQGNFNELIAFQTSWPKAQPHSFWWDNKDIDELMCYYGRPEEFVAAGRSNYRGIDCFVLQFFPRDLLGIVVGQSYRCDCGMEDRLEYGRIGEVRGLADQSYRWYIGTEDHLLHGLLWLVSNKPHVEHWMLDYKEVYPGCRLPMTQGYELYNRDGDSEPYLEARRDLKIVEVSINKKLPDNLFQIELSKGVKVIDNRLGRSATYTYEPDPPGMAGKTLPKFTDFNTSFTSEQAEDKRILVCFFDMGQRPSRHCMMELANQAQQLRQNGLAIVAVQASKVEENTLEDWIKNKNISFAVGMIDSDEEQTKLTWGVKSLPWLIMTDREHIVQAEGFSISELDNKIKEVTVVKR
jgi:hypothetical protein